ncbi:hypothetical protein [Lunatibacter salilacus]|uniref:hypothetical protein n=1 Tax=Lunatibacter salilacus TaxID=2483804 RepID=UPI00131DFCC5|nr:hypothetical protein [Lunatibacter salilacus]
MPTGHALQFPIALSLPDRRVINLTPANKWLVLPLQESFNSRKTVSIKIKQNRVVQSDPILLNCLDTCFGHLYSKLWNAQTLVKWCPQNDIIVLLPAKYAWMVPNEVSEIWMVDVSLLNCQFFLDGLDEWIKKQMERFEKVLLSQAYIHLDHHAYVDLEQIVGQKRFDLNQFQLLPLRITFILREDRFWHNSLIMDFLYKLSVKYKLQHIIKPLFLWRQKHLVHKTIKNIQNLLPEVQFYATGLGNSLSYAKSLKDLRVSEINLETERIWNAVYAQSHLVIGVHGSHMLIPTSLAAGFINLLPRYKIDHIVEDSVLPYTNRMLQFMGRFLDEFSTSSLISNHVVSLMKTFPAVFENTNRIPE